MNLRSPTKGVFRIFFSSAEQGKSFPFRKRLGLINRLKSQNWKPLKIEFFEVDFTYSGMEVLEALKTRPDIKAIYNHCILLKEKVADLTTQTENTKTEVVPPAYQANKESKPEVIKSTGNDNIWRGLSNASLQRALALTESELALDGLQTEISIYKTWEYFFQIKTKEASDFKIVASAADLIAFTQDPILGFINDLFRNNHNLSNWKTKFDELFVLTKNIYFHDQRSFVINLIQYLIDTKESSLFANQSLNVYLNNPQHLEELTNNLTELKSVHSFYQEFANHPDDMSVTLMNTTKTLRTQIRVLQEENEKLRSSLQKETILAQTAQQPNTTTEIKKSINYQNSFVLYGMSPKQFSSPSVPSSSTNYTPSQKL